MPFKLPGFKSGVIFIGMYLIFLRVLLKKIEKPGRGRWRYSLGLLVTIIILAVIGYRGFYYPNLRQKLTYNTFGRLEVSDADVPAFASIIIGLYALHNSGYGFNFGSEPYPVEHLLPMHSRSKLPPPYVLQAKDGGQQIAGSLDRWSEAFYRLQLDIDSPLAGDARADNSFLTLRVENKLAHNLIDCLVYYKRRFVLVDDILADSQQVLKLSLTGLKETEIFNEQEVERILRLLDGRGATSFLRSAQANLLKDLLLEIDQKYQSSADSMILIGWMPAGLIEPNIIPAGLSGSGLTMVSWRLPVETTS